MAKDKEDLEMNTLRQASGYALMGIGVLALAYSAWLSFVLLSALARASAGEILDIGLGVVVLVYAALPATIALLSLSYLLASQPSRRAGTVLTALGFVLAVIQLGWLLDLGLRVGKEPWPFAIGASIAVIGVTVATWRATPHAAHQRVTGVAGRGGPATQA